MQDYNDSQEVSHCTASDYDHSESQDQVDKNTSLAFPAPVARHTTSTNMYSLSPQNSLGFNYCDDEDKDGGEIAASLRMASEEYKVADAFS